MRLTFDVVRYLYKNR